MATAFEGLKLLSDTVRRGMTDVSNARIGAANRALQERLIERRLRREDELAPVRQAQIGKANEYLAEQKWLNEPIKLGEAMGHIFGDKPDEQTAEFVLSNDVMGAIANSMNAKFDPNTKTFSIGGKPVTRKQFAKAGPLIGGIVDAKMDPKKAIEMKISRLEDRKKSNVGNKSAIEKDIKDLKSKINQKDQQWLLDNYEKQAKRLTAFKGMLVQNGGNTQVVDDALSRISRRRKEILATNLANKTLAAKQMRLKPGITEKDIANKWIELGIQAKRISDLNRFNGAYNNHPMTGKPFTEEQIAAAERKWQIDQFTDAMIAAGVYKQAPAEKKTKTTKGFTMKGEPKAKSSKQKQPKGQSTRKTLDAILRDTSAERENRKKEGRFSDATFPGGPYRHPRRR